MPATQIPIWRGMTPTGAVLWKWSVLNYDALSVVIDQQDGDIARVIDSQGTLWLPGSLGGTYYPSGFYTWIKSEAVWKMDKNIEQIANALSNVSGQKPSVFFNTANSALTDSTTYYLVHMGVLSPSIGGFSRLPIKCGKVTGVRVNVYNASTIGSSESLTLRLKTDDGVESNVITTVLKVDANRNKYQSFTDLDIDVSDGNCWFEIDVPVMATNPNAVQIRIELIIE